MLDNNTAVETLEEDQIDKLLELKDKIKTEASNNSYFGFDMAPIKFYKLMCLLPSQMYGPRIEAYTLSALGLSRVPAGHDRGDGVTSYDKYVEFKVSYTSAAGTFNFLQFRPWQQLDGVVLLAIDKEEAYKPYFFFLTKEQVAFEIALAGGLCHLNRRSVRNNKNAEYRVTLKKYDNLYDYLASEPSEQWQRWVDEYSQPSLECLKLKLESIL